MKFTIESKHGKERVFKCKRCGKIVTENYSTWEDKPQTQKRICLKCIGKLKVINQRRDELRRERARNAYMNLLRSRMHM